MVFPLGEVTNDIFISKPYLSWTFDNYLQLRR